jgi:hypothetical protein
MLGTNRKLGIEAETVSGRKKGLSLRGLLMN